ADDFRPHLGSVMRDDGYDVRVCHDVMVGDDVAVLADNEARALPGADKTLPVRPNLDAHHAGAYLLIKLLQRYTFQPALGDRGGGLLGGSRAVVPVVPQVDERLCHG